MLEPRISKRKYQQAGTKANQKLGHKLREKTITRNVAATDLLYIDQTRTAEIGVHPKYRNGGCSISHEAWAQKAKQWDADHDVARPAKPKNRKSRKRDKTPRPAQTYRAARRNAAPHVNRRVVTLKPTHTWPLPNVPKLIVKARLARQAAAHPLVRTA